MKRFFIMAAAALVSAAVWAGANDLLWDYSEAAPSANPDNGLTYGSKLDDATLKGIKMNSSGFAYFTKAAVAGKLKLTFGPRNGGSVTLIVSTWSGASPAAETQIKTTKTLTEMGYEIIELSETQNNIYISRSSSGNEGVLQKIQFTELVPREFVDFKIDFRSNPYTVLLPEGGALPAGVSVAGSWHDEQHGYENAKVTVKVDGPVKFTIGTCQHGSEGSVVNKAGTTLATLDLKTECDNSTGFDKNLSFTYTGGADELTLNLGKYCPYLFAEACEITPCDIIFKDQNGKELGKVTTYEGALLEAIPYAEKDLPEISEGSKFRGWFYSNNKKAKAGDVISGNTTIQARVTPVEKATVGSVQNYNLNDATFYPEDHETIEMSNGSFHDGQHGWYFAADGSVKVQVAGKAIVNVSVCQYSEDGDVVVKAGEKELAKMTVEKNKTADGAELSAKYDGEAGWVTVSFTNKQYIHKISVYNVQDFLEKDASTGYYIVPAGDVASFLLALVQANGEGNAKIFLPDGVYDLGETVLTTVSGNNISIIGQSMLKTIIKNAPDASTESIDKTATIKINKNVKGTYLQDLTIQNALDYYKSNNGRAVALWDQGTQTVCKNVRLLSYQDTYYSNLQGAVKYFEDCEIHGTVDFICGDGSVYFKNNLLYCEKRQSSGGGSDALTANNGVATDRGYVFESCTVKSECPLVSLGRAWNNTPTTTFLNLLVDESAGKFSFSDDSKIQRWTKELMNANAWPKFGEYNTHLADGTVLTPASNKVSFIDKKSGNATKEIETVLTAEQAAQFTMAYTLGDWAATAANDAKQAVAEKEASSFEPNGIYLVEKDGAFAAIILGSEYMDHFAVYDGTDYTVRKANARGGFGYRAGEEPKEAVENVQSGKTQSAKFFRDGQLVIVRDGKEYNVLGAQL